MNMAELPVMPDTLTLLNDVLMAVDALPTKIEHATVSSRAVLVGSLFLAYPGAAHDGRRYINDAVARGAAAVLCEAEGMSRQELAAISVPVITVAGLKNFASAIGAHVCHHPSEKLWMVGVTGTNGKTSVAQWVAHALQLTDRRTAVIGTIGSGMVGAMLGPRPNRQTPPRTACCCSTCCVNLWMPGRWRVRWRCRAMVSIRVGWMR